MDTAVEKRINDLDFKAWLDSIEREILKLKKKQTKIIEINPTDPDETFNRFNALRARILRIRKTTGLDFKTIQSGNSLIVIRVS